MRTRSSLTFGSVLLRLAALLMLISTAFPAPTQAKADRPARSRWAEARSTDAAAIYLRAGTFVPAAGQELNVPAELSSESLPTSESGYYIVQFSGPVQEAWKEQVGGAGGTIFDYVPDFAFIVRMDDAAHAAVMALPQVAWVGPYRPAYKLSPDLAGRTGMLDLIVQTFPGESTAAVASDMASATGQAQAGSESKAGGLLRLQIDAARLDELARIPAVRWIEPFYERVLLNDVARGSGIMDAETPWTDLGLYGQGQIVAVADSGLDTGNVNTLHQDFLGGPTGCSGTDRVVATFALGRTNDWSDSCFSIYGNVGGHGTHVSGSVLGNGCRSGSNGLPAGYAGSYAGLAPQARLVMQSAMDSSCELTGLPDDLNVLFSQARNEGARIHTNSWGEVVAGQYTTYARTADEFTWNNKDASILFAAGNSGVDANGDGFVDTDSLNAPGTAKNVITVGASENDRATGGYNPGGACSTWGGCWPSTNPAAPIYDDGLSNNATGMAAFSSRGPTDDGRIKPDVVAPGTNILSTKSQATYVSEGWGAGPTPYYQYMGGTSMATPLTAGAVALIRQFYTDIKGVTPSGALLKATLINSATDLYPGQYNSPSEYNPRLPNTAQGWGRVNVASATDDTHVWQDIADADGLATGASQSYSYEACGASTFKVTLVWTDYPGATPAAKELVNDLDLVVTAPDGTTTYRGNVFSNGWSAAGGAAGGAADRTNNVESVYLQTPAAGVWNVAVSGYNVPNGSSGRQGYALVIDRPGFTGCYGFTVAAAPATLDVCAPGDASYTVNVGQLGGFTAAVTLAAAGYPAGATASFGANPVTPPGSSTLTITDMAAAAAGSYALTVTGAAGALTRQGSATLNLSVGLPAAPTLTTPASGSTGQPTIPTFTWNAAAGATRYAIEIATDPGFSAIVAQAGGLTGTNYTPADALTGDTVYYWRVQALNACGSRYAASAAFRTAGDTVCTDVMGDGGFEAGQSNSFWFESSSTGHAMIYQDATYAHGGSWMAWLGYYVNENSQVWQAPAISASATSATLTYWYQISSDNFFCDWGYYDYGYLKINGNTKTTYELCSDTDTAGAYVQAAYDMSSYKGTAPEVRFQAKTNTLFESHSSFIIDDVALDVCAASPSVTADYSDLASGYGIAWHAGTGALRLGATWDEDTTFAPDADNSSDDGVSFIGPFQAGATATLRVNIQGTPVAGRWLRAWFDWNADGEFDAGERVYEGSVTDGDNDLAVNIPSTVSDAVKYRVRLYDSATAPAADALGGVSGGEVEDGLTPCVASAPVAEITISEPASDQVALTWTAPAGAAHYQIWRALNEPYFNPGSDCSAPGAYACTETADTSFTESLADGNPAYVVRAMSTCGSYSGAAYQRVSRFRFSLTPGQ